ncbi:MAG: hypothetical protein HUJ25_16635 [Crocinitomicaceae bacterium]|nr:hypothetical protein [Crocinitomicaceae bacterium]
MKGITFRLLLVSTFGLFAISGYGQNGWTRAKNGFYAQAVLSTFNTNEYYSTTGTLFNGGSTFRSNALLFYGEYGVTDRFNVLLDAPLLVLNKFSTTEMVAGVGSIKLGAKYRLLKNFPLAAQIDFDIPTDDGFNYATSTEPNSLGTYDQINLPTSDGEFNIWTTLAASHSIASGKTFGSIYGSFNFRTKSFSHQIQAGFEIGQLLWDKLYVIGKFKIQEKIGSGSAGGSFLYGEGTTFSRYNLTLLYKTNEHWKIVGGFSDFIGFPVPRRNLYDGFMFFLGASVEY